MREKNKCGSSRRLCSKSALSLQLVPKSLDFVISMCSLQLVVGWVGRYLQRCAGWFSSSDCSAQCTVIYKCEEAVHGRMPHLLLGLGGHNGLCSLTGKMQCTATPALSQPLRSLLSAEICLLQ
ncbi:hypothetical protein SETIT_1G365000v2 [Setaria italica]|uniref:Uncharacterized protein n=2 Tax=Setaria TaxID=4554 RepID=A0A368PTZ5_SETIT|nr:hypothetical protein SETIT_1G365000v2 [Setaria italica]TKW42248.1 hypothetical protein SEVIR_1G371600v2 [Setaria viridis]